MKKLGIYIIIFTLTILFRNNICFMYGNILGVFKLDNDYKDAIINVKEEKIKYLENEISSLNNFSSSLEYIKYDYKVSKVLFKDTYNSNVYNIQFGKEDKITMGSGVINEYGFVGKITNVNSKTCELTTMKKIKNISVKINDSYGKMSYSDKDDLFIVKGISNYDKVYVNDEVYTSGYGTIKENLYIGKVIKVINKDYEKELLVKSNVDFNNINYILIVGDFN